MGNVPQRLKIAELYRSVFRKIETRLWVPNVNPSVYQLAAIFLSFVFLFSDDRLFRFLLLTFILFMDWWDGATARRYGTAGESGYMIDVFVDRISELIMFFPLHRDLSSLVWFSLSLLNLGLSYVGFRTGKHTIMALRFFYLFYIWI